MIRGKTPMAVGDLVMVREYLGIIIKIIDNARYKEGVLHFKIYIFQFGNSAWFNANAITMVSPPQ
jgi:hypothetical protein